MVARMSDAAAPGPSPFDERLSQAWQRHAEHSRAVADELPQLVPLLQSDDDVRALAHLARHLFGEHLGAWTQGQQFLMTLQQAAGRRELLVAGGAAETHIQRCSASLALARGARDMRRTMNEADRLAVTIFAACDLGPHDGARARHLFEEAMAAAAALPPASPLHRVLATNCNNIAGTLQELPQRSENQRRLMIEAAQAARHHWEHAGTWLEVERAEYRLAHCWLAAGNPEVARHHANECLRIVEENDGAALEWFFGYEPLVRAERELGNADAVREALANMERAFERLSDDDKAWCRKSLEALILR